MAGLVRRVAIRQVMPWRTRFEHRPSVCLPLYTRNSEDFSGLEGVIKFVDVRA